MPFSIRSDDPDDSFNPTSSYYYARSMVDRELMRILYDTKQRWDVQYPGLVLEVIRKEHLNRTEFSWKLGLGLQAISKTISVTDELLVDGRVADIVMTIIDQLEQWFKKFAVEVLLKAYTNR